MRAQPHTLFFFEDLSHRTHPPPAGLRDEEAELARTQEAMASASAAVNSTEKRLEAGQLQLRRQQEEYRQRVAGR